MWPTIVGALGALAVALVARIPALSREARINASIKSDLELLTLMPEGPAHDAFRDAVMGRVAQVAEEREKGGRDLRVGALTATLIALTIFALWFPALRHIYWPRLSTDAQMLIMMFAMTAATLLVAAFYAALLRSALRRRNERLRRMEAAAAGPAKSR